MSVITIIRPYVLNTAIHRTIVSPICLMDITSNGKTNKLKSVIDKTNIIYQKVSFSPDFKFAGMKYF